MWIITDGSYYWSNKFGWGELVYADRFTLDERHTLNLPMGGRWRLDV